jgi:hypothetical protein
MHPCALATGDFLSCCSGDGVQEISLPGTHGGTVASKIASYGVAAHAGASQGTVSVTLAKLQSLSSSSKVNDLHPALRRRHGALQP